MRLNRHSKIFTLHARELAALVLTSIFLSACSDGIQVDDGTSSSVTGSEPPTTNDVTAMSDEVAALDPEPDPALDPEPDPAPDPEPEPEPDPALDPELDPAPDREPDPALDPELDPAPDRELDPAPDRELDPAPDREPDPALDPEPDPLSDPTTEVQPVEQDPVVETDVLQTPADLFQRDGYDSLDVVRVDIRTETTPGVCSEDDVSGCTLTDVNEDIDTSDDLQPEIEVHFQAADYANDSSLSNAELQQRGASARLFPQKSYRVKIDKDAMQWRGERRLQLNKHPADVSRLRNKLSFDLMSNVPHLPSLRTQFVNLWIDDGDGPTDYGLFTHVEALKKEFLEKRGWNEDDNLYKAEQFAFSESDMRSLALDETGAPLDEDRFETRLSIKKGGDDNRQLITMLTAVNDPSQNFDAVMEKYFDRGNVLMWVTVNFLLGQRDVTTHNFYLYNPVGTEKFYFLPWDYDAAFYIETNPDENFENTELRRRLFYGYARGTNSIFLDRYYRLPGINDAIVEAANELRSGPLSDTEISQRVSLYSDLVRPYLTRQPDIQHLSTSTLDATSAFDSQIRQLAEYVATNHQVLQDGLDIPMPPTLDPPVRVSDDEWMFSWSPAYSVTGHSISYDLQVATDVEFSANTIVFDVVDIQDSANNVQQAVPTSNLPEGTLFYRVIARSSKDPETLWQVATNKVKIEDFNWFGVEDFESVR